MRKLSKTLLVAALFGLLAGPALADQPQDAWVTTKVKMKLLTADDINPIAINVDTIDGVVTLQGKVETDALKTAAAREASQVEGVRDVRNLLAVVPGKAKEQVKASDDQVRSRVVTVLERDKSLENSDIEVQSVNNGVVVLAGSADTLTSHRRALEDARSVDGVRKVASEIRSPDKLGDREIWDDASPGTSGVRSSASDTWITTKVKVALMREPGISPFAVNVDTRDAVVTLFGSVDSNNAKQIAEARVKKIEGVKAVANELQVVPDVAAERVEAADDDLVTAVKQRLAARDSLREADIDVEVSNRVVRLTGTVPSFSDRLTALTVARGTKGVDSVIDDLQLDKSKG